MEFNLLYNDPLDDFLEQTRNSARGRVRERGVVSSIAPTPEEFRGTGVPYNEALQERSIADALYPVREGLDDQQADRLNTLGRKAERLNQPTPHRSVGTPANPGNPFSLDTRGLSGSVTRIGAALKDRQNEKTLGEISPELRRLGEQQQAAQESAQGRSDYMRERVPQVIDQNRERDFDRETAQGDREHDVNIQEMRGQQAIDREEAIGNRMKEVETLKSQLANDPNNPETRRMYISAINNYIKASNPGLDLIPQKIKMIRDRSGGDLTPEEEEIVENLERQYVSAKRNAARMYEELGAVPGRNPQNQVDETGIEFMRTAGLPESEIQSYADYLGIDYKSDGESVDTGEGERQQQRGRFDP